MRNVVNAVRTDAMRHASIRAVRPATDRANLQFTILLTLHVCKAEKLRIHLAPRLRAGVALDRCAT